MNFIPILERLEHNEALFNNIQYQNIIWMTIANYKLVGFMPPWIGYIVEENGEWIGSAGFKGMPINNQVEIAYGTVEAHQNKGIGNKMCKKLVEISLKTNPTIRITARTLPFENYSTKILRKNNFIKKGTIEDPEDGPVWEWVYDSK